MSKKVSLLILALAIFVLAGCGKEAPKNNSETDLKVDAPKEVVKIEEENVNEINEEVQKIAEAMRSGKKMKCFYEVPIDGAQEGTVKTVVY